MYALSFDMRIADREEHYGNPYHGAYYEIKRKRKRKGWEAILKQSRLFS